MRTQIYEIFRKKIRIPQNFYKFGIGKRKNARDMYGKFQKYLQDELQAIEEAGLYKKERNIASPQSAEITLQDGRKALNFCANNYLGLSDSPRLAAAAEKAMKERG